MIGSPANRRKRPASLSRTSALFRTGTRVIEQQPVDHVDLLRRHQRRHMLARLPDHPANKVADLLPWNWNVNQQSKAAVAA
jgi:hypothetical protein